MARGDGEGRAQLAAVGVELLLVLLQLAEARHVLLERLVDLLEVVEPLALRLEALAHRVLMLGRTGLEFELKGQGITRAALLEGLRV